MQDEDDEWVGGAYADGHWIWDENKNSLEFISDLQDDTIESIHTSNKAPTGTIDFRDDIDVIEQIKFRRRYQRKVKPGTPDVITLQDVKDLALFTAPVQVLSHKLIDFLHLRTTERFIRALIFSCQYYIQVTEEMAFRMTEAQKKVRTETAEIKENEYRDNLMDLRLLVAKEYCTMILGGDEVKRFHHMGTKKVDKSMSDMDAKFFETLLRMCVQIIWLALGRRCFNQIELEVHRLFKTTLYNSREHILHTGYMETMSEEERRVLLGQSVKTQDKLTVQSPLLCDAVVSNRIVDYRVFGLGVIKYDKLSVRLKHMLSAIAGPEESLANLGITVGILGLARSEFDTMLQPLPKVLDKSKQKLSTASLASTQSARRSLSSKKSSIMKSSLEPGHQKVYPDIYLPPESQSEAYEPAFPDILEEVLPCNEVQRRRWHGRLRRLLNPNRHSVVSGSNRRKSAHRK